MIFNLILSFLFLAACQHQEEKNLDNLYEEVLKDFPQVPTVKNIPKKDFVLIDVRTIQERAISKIPGALSLEEFHQKKIPKDWLVIVYCTIGYRSAEVVLKLLQENPNVFNLEKGILGYIEKGGMLHNINGGKTYLIHPYGKKWEVIPKNFKVVYSLSP